MNNIYGFPVSERKEEFDNLFSEHEITGDIAKRMTKNLDEFRGRIEVIDCGLG